MYLFNTAIENIVINPADIRGKIMLLLLPIALALVWLGIGPYATQIANGMRTTSTIPNKINDVGISFLENLDCWLGVSKRFI
jgi:hypothetical protein